MLRAKRFVSLRTQRNTPVFPLPKSLPKDQLLKAKAQSLESNEAFDSLASSSTLDMKPSALENLLYLNLCTGQHDRVRRIATRVQRDPLSSRFKTPQFYSLLLQSLSESRGSLAFALQLYLELSRLKPPTELLRGATIALLTCASSCTDFTQLLPLRIIYENCITKQLPDTFIEAKFLASVTEILINTNQIRSAVDHLHISLLHLTDKDQKAFLEFLPTSKILSSLCKVHDTQALVWFLNALTNHFPSSFISAEDWALLLNLGLSLNSYDLVKFVYSNVFMEGLQDQVSVEDVVLLNKFAEHSEANKFFASITDATIGQILQTLASAGDVESTLNLIEWHYIHKSLKGEKALTSDLCIAIIRSYCLFDEDTSDSLEDDRSVKNVIDVVESFISRGEANISYKDVTDAFSHKLNTYRAYDDSVHAALMKESAIVNPPEPAEEDEELPMPQKRTNQNVNVSIQGSVLLKTDILRQFTKAHVNYILEHRYGVQTLQLFIDCLLNHLKKYQNSSSILTALAELKAINPNFKEDWLTDNSFDILVHSISMSQPSMASGLKLYRYFKENWFEITHKRFECFILSSLRGVSYNSLLEFYVYEYLKVSPRNIATTITQRIRNYSNLNEQGRELLKCLEELKLPGSESVDEIWKSHNFNSSIPVIADSTGEHAKYAEMDRRDEKRLEELFG